MKLYALLDFDTLKKKNRSIEQFIFTCKKLDVQIIQYRDKKGDNNRKKNNLQKIKSLCDITLLINDEISLVEFCDGLHVGQNDLHKIHENKDKAIQNIRKIIKRKILGISTHNEIEIYEANNLDIDYKGLGAFRATSTKDDATVLGESLSDLARLSLKPVGAIGGVKVTDEIENITYNVVGNDLYEY
jgi:thiamine-phosphate pyrophosphorylase